MASWRFNPGSHQIIRRKPASSLIPHPLPFARVTQGGTRHAALRPGPEWP
jgi:hypothetical protein